MMKRKVGRPKGSKNKMTKAKFEKAIEPSLEKLKIVHQLRQETLRLHHIIDRLNGDIANFNHQIIGYKAVISYLENQLGLKGSQ